jgi:branched-chain amino acid transport system substrate-binding protein
VSNHAGRAVGLAAALTVTLGADLAAAREQHVPLLVYRTGPYAPNGVPLAQGQADYLAMLNARDGGVGGVRLAVETCDTAYDVDQGLECYARLKDGGPTGAAAFSPFSTGIAYALVERARVDEIPLFTLGHGRSDTADGTVFPYVFPLPVTYASQATSILRYIEEREGGDLAGADIALVHLDNAYGREPIPALEATADRAGFTLHRFAVAHPGLEQRAVWLDVAELAPDWTILWGWGVMNATAIREAAAAGFPVERLVGNPWAAAEVDVERAGEAAVGYLAANFHAAGADFGVHEAIRTHVYADDGRAPPASFGGVLYNRGVLNAAVLAEALRIAQEIHGARPLRGAEIRDGFENLTLDADRLAELGLAGFAHPIALSCADHEGGGAVFVQRWDGEAWRRVSDWIEPMPDVVRPLIEQSAGAYAADAGITPRACPREGG